MSPSRCNSAQPTESRGPPTRSKSGRVEEGEFGSSDFTDQIQRKAEGQLSGIPRFDFNISEVTEQGQNEAGGEFREIPELVTESSSDEEQFDQQHEDIMSYLYAKYNDKTNMDVHIRAFLMKWQANHVLQRLSEADANKSKIEEIGLSLEQQEANCYSQHEAGEFGSFKILTTKFI